MNRRIVGQRFDGIGRAKELMEIADKRELTAEEIEELKQSHTGYGGITWSDTNQFFTPKVVVDFARDMLGKLNDGTSVLEFSCGSGAFIDSLYEKNPNIEVTGIELNFTLAKLATICYPKANIIQGDALEYMNQFKDSFDLIIGNPPYGKGPKRIDGFEYAKGKLEEYFLEMAVHCLKEGGEAILIMPDGICSNSSSEGIRKWLIEQCYFRASISLPVETFYFAGTGCKTTAIYFKKKYKGCTLDNYSAFMAICEKIGWNSRGQMSGQCDLDEIKEAYFSMAEEQQKTLFVPPQQLKWASNI